jgi:outer membrane protein assembly factor BamB/predicted MPP superfamily phosphohydrolase
MRILFTGIFVFCLYASAAFGQRFSFAFVSDTHIGNITASEDLRRTVKDINTDSSLKFVVISGDITEFGSDEELLEAKQILDSLNIPWYIVPGNHDSNWSESGANSFRRIFGGETFSFQYGGFMFLGTSSGPNMRMGPGQVPRENIEWLDSVLNKLKEKEMPIVYINHYPQDSSQNNWYEAIDRLKKENIQLILCGHGHSNHKLNFEGIPAVMGRSNLRAKDSVGGYNIVSFENAQAVFSEKTPLHEIRKQWAVVSLSNHHFQQDTTRYFRPTYTQNNSESTRLLWSYQHNSDIGSGMAQRNNLVFLAGTDGSVFALDKRNGKRRWSYSTGGKIYSSPAVSAEFLVFGSSDNHIYCVVASNGKFVWKHTASKAVLGSPVIINDIVFIGSSDGHFRALQLKTGKQVWDFPEVKGFVVTRPLIYNDIVYFGSWGTEFYALAVQTGKLIWKWNNGSSNRMFSPAACYPVGANNRIFIVAPDRYMTAFNASSGEVIWRKQMPAIRVRESMGLSKDSSMVYVKTMEGEGYGVSTTADSMKIIWKANMQMGYEISPSAVIENNNMIYFPSHSGVVFATDRTTGNPLWKYKASNCLVNDVMPIGKNKLIISTSDGRITCIEFDDKLRTY